MPSELPPASPSAPPPIADYELLRLIGRGSYGDVWLARGVTGVFRAVKIVWRDRFTDIRPYEREFEGITRFAAISLREPSQLALLHAGRQDAAGFFYYVMELADDVTGGREIDPATYVPCTLKDFSVQRGHRLDTAEVVALGTALARALASLHSAGLVHRDIKPSNVILVGGVPKLADVGLVALASAQLTFVGTEGFVPPEGPGAPSADVYSLGKLLYELATGLDRHDWPRLPPDLDTRPDQRHLLELNEVLVRACEPDASRRFADAGELLEDLLLLQAGKSVRNRTRWRRTRRQFAFVAAVTTLGAVAYSHWPAVLTATRTFVNKHSGLLVAILPLDVVGGDASTAALGAGLQDELAATLLRLSNARVLTVGSVRAAKVGPGDFRAAKDLLGVGAVLTGNIQRFQESLRFTIQLVDVRDGAVWWTKRYERRETDLFNLQTDIATDVALQMEAQLRPSASRRSLGTSSKNTAAQRLFLEGRALAGDARAAGPDLLRACERFAEAAALDSGFALALAHLSLAETRLFLWGHDRTNQRLERGLEAAQRALRLNPDLAEAQAALGIYYYRRSRDYATARVHINRAFALAPNNPDVRSVLAGLERRSGSFETAAAHFRAALELDPLNGTLAYNTADTLVRLRQYPEAEAIIARSLTLLPKHVALTKLLGDLHVLWRGDLTAMRADLTTRDPSQPSAEIYLMHKIDWLILEGRIADALATLRASTLDVLDAQSIYLNRDGYEAMLLQLAGDRAAARETAGRAYARLKPELARLPNDPRVLLHAGQLTALLGDPAEGERLIRRTLTQDDPARVDGFDRGFFLNSLAITLATADEHDRAREALRTALHEPGQLSPYYIKLHPALARYANDSL